MGANSRRLFTLGGAIRFCSIGRACVRSRSSRWPSVGPCVLSLMTRLRRAGEARSARARWSRTADVPFQAARDAGSAIECVPTRERLIARVPGTARLLIASASWRRRRRERATQLVNEWPAVDGAAPIDEDVHRSATVDIRTDVARGLTRIADVAIPGIRVTGGRPEARSGVPTGIAPGITRRGLRASAGGHTHQHSGHDHVGPQGPRVAQRGTRFHCVCSVA